METYYIMTDGGAHGFNGNDSTEKCGSIGSVILDSDRNELGHRIKIPFKDATNNMCELLGCILTTTVLFKALERNNKLNSVDIKIIIGCDSQQVVKALDEWMPKWKANGWKKPSDKKPPKNVELYKLLYDLYFSRPNIKFETHWIKGHLKESDASYDKFFNKYNNICDKLANEAFDEYDYSSYKDFKETFTSVKETINNFSR